MKNLISILLSITLLSNIIIPVYAEEECIHDFSGNKTQEVTCTTPGYSATYCIKCGQWETEPTIINPLGHDYDKETITITIKDNKKYINAKCTRCNENVVDLLTVLNCPHINTKGGNETIATCITNGGLQPTICNDCNRILDHGNPTPALGHKWDDGVIKIKPTTESTGIMLYTCTRSGCSVTKEVTIKKLTNKPTVIDNTHKVIEIKPDIEIKCPKITVYGDANKNVTSETLKTQIYNNTNDNKTLSVLYKIIKMGTVNKITNKTQLLDATEHSDYSEKTKENVKNWIINSLTIKTAYENVTDLDIFTVNNIKGFKKSFKVYVLRPAKISGYQIKYSRNKNFSKSKTIKVTSKKSTYTVKKLASKKTYYVKCRAYKYSSKTKKYIYSNWTYPTKIKTK